MPLLADYGHSVSRRLSFPPPHCPCQALKVLGQIEAPSLPYVAFFRYLLQQHEKAANASIKLCPSQCVPVSPSVQPTSSQSQGFVSPWTSFWSSAGTSRSRKRQHDPRMAFEFIRQFNYSTTLNISLDLSEPLPSSPEQLPYLCLLCSCSSLEQEEVTLLTTAAALNLRAGSGQQQPAMCAL